MKTGIVFEGGAFRTIFSCGVMDAMLENKIMPDYMIGVSVSYTHLRAHETDSYLVCRLLLEKKNYYQQNIV